MEIRVLGPLELVSDGRLVPLRRGQQRRLLLALLLRAGERVRADQLIDELWGESAPKNAENALQILVSYLRKVLADGGGTARIDTIGGGYRLDVAPDAVDLFRFDRGLAELTSVTDPADRIARIEEALALWRGAPLIEVADDLFAQGEVRRLEEARLHARESRLAALLDLGRHEDVVGELQQLVLQHPLRERLSGLLMLALYRCGRQAESLAAYDAVRDRLLEEFGLDPGPELQELARAVLQQAPDLQPPRSSPRMSAAPISEHVPTDVAADERCSTLPATLAPLIGREHELERLVTLCGERRLLTLTGPGGAGKTRLATEVAVQLLRSGRLLWWVDLSTAHDGDTVTDAIAAAIGVSLPAGDGLSALSDGVGGRAATLLLDTCEHVVGHLRPVVEHLLRTCPQLSLLTTSRQPLGVVTELAWPVPPLSLPDPRTVDPEELLRSAAVRLFVERAADRRPDFHLSTENAAAVSAICLLLDGLPLAIELAAAHVDVFTPAKLVTLLDDRLRVLIDPARPVRHQALRSTIAWSYDLLDEEQASFFRRLAVFSGPFPFDAAVAVSGDGLTGDGLTLLLGLVGQSLVHATGDDRFRLLDTVQAFAAERLREHEAEETAAAARHAQWYLDVVRQVEPRVYGRDGWGWIAELRAERANLLTALEWSFGHGNVDLAGSLASRLAWLWAVDRPAGSFARAFAIAEEVVEPGTLQHAHVLGALGAHALRLGDLAQAVERCQEAIHIYRDQDHTSALPRTLVYVGVAYWGLRRYDEAAAAHDEAIELFDGLASPWGLAVASILRARTAADRGEADVLDRLSSALPVATQAGVHHLVFEQQARYSAYAGRYEQAADLAARGLAAAERAGDEEAVLAAMNVLGIARLGQGRVEDAAQLHRRALEQAREMQHPGATAESLELLARVEAATDDHRGAAQHLTEADATRERAGIPRPASLERFMAGTSAAPDTERLPAAEAVAGAEPE